MTTQRAQHSVVLADDITDLIAVKIAACGARPVALTSADRQLAAAGSSPKAACPASSPSHCTSDATGEAGALRVTHSMRDRPLHVPARNRPTPSEENRKTQL
jgi:hypothetical protein